MKTPTLPCIILSLLLVPLLPAQEAREAAPQAAPVKPEIPSKEVLRLVRFPETALMFEPALGAVMKLTPAQEEELKKAWEETVGQAQKDMAGNDDKFAVQSEIQRAERDFGSARDSILTEEQITFLETMRQAGKSGELKAREASLKSGKKSDRRVFFLNELKPCLTPGQLALVEAAGGKFPETSE